MAFLSEIEDVKRGGKVILALMMALVVEPKRRL
jgi:hypothetical protein